MSGFTSPVLAEWAAANPSSEMIHRRSRDSLVDGVTQDVRAEPPFPVFIVDTAGARVTTADGDELICYVMGHGSLLLGHKPPAVVKAVQEQSAVAFHYGGSHPGEVEWAERILELFPSADKVRFTSSGSEATMLACRLARGYTGRERIVKLNGHFSGWHDSVIRGFAVPFDRRFAGVPSAVFERTVSIQPEMDLLRACLDGGEVAAVILEPAGGYSGAVPIPPEFVRMAQAECARTETLFVFDEVVTGFRWSPGGAQATLGIEPDLTTLGKIVAGGLPGAAVVGRDAVMHGLGVTRGFDKVVHTGTHNGHPLAAAAGTATLDLIRDGQHQRAAADTCSALIDGFNGVLHQHGVSGLAYGASSHFCLLLGVPAAAGVSDAAELGSEVLRAGTPSDVQAAVNCAMMLNGVHLFHGHGFVSSAHDRGTTGKTIDAFDRSVARLKGDGVV